MNTISQQIINNATSWVGHVGQRDETRGQTFVAPSSRLQAIEVIPNLVSNEGHLEISLHRFDKQSNKWGEKINDAVIGIDRSAVGSWVAFPVNTPLQPGETYGFKLTSHDALIGVGEAAGVAGNPPYADGGEWAFKANEEARGFRYFSLAFKLKMSA